MTTSDSVAGSGDRLPVPAVVTVWAGLIGVAAGLAVHALGLYHRVRGSRVLEHEMRRKVYDVVSARPGLTLGEVAAQVPVKRQTVEYHLRVLAREGHVAVARVPGRRLFYATGALPGAGTDASVVVAQASATFARILAHVKQNPGVTTTQLRETLGLSRAHAGYYLQRFEREALIRRERVSHNVTRVYPA